MDDLEAHPAGLDSDEADGGNGSKLPLLALIIGLIGIVVGIAGIYMATQTGNEFRSYQEAQAARPDTTSQRLRDLEQQVEDLGGTVEEADRQLASLEERFGAMGTAHVAVQRAQREMRDQTQRAFEDVSREVSANRTQLNDTTGRLEELIQRVQSGTARRMSPAPSTSESTATSDTSASADGDSSTPPAVPPATAEDGIHVVEQGDTLSSIAGRYGVSLSQLMAANPGVDPRRMRIGQHIVIPES